MKTIRKKKMKNKTFKKNKKRYHHTRKTRNKYGGSDKIIKSKKINCSPKSKDQLNDYSCYTNKSLIELRDHWNARHPDVNIETNSPKEIHSKLSEYLKDVCNNEACWLKQKGVFGQLESELADSFAPDSPSEWKKNPNEWLSSVDIMKVMKQYEKAYKCFDFMGPTPINFDTKKLYGECVWEELVNLTLKNLLRKVKQRLVLFSIPTQTINQDNIGFLCSLILRIRRYFSLIVLVTPHHQRL